MIAIGCDHGALDLKNQLIDHLKKRGIECKDTGCYTNESCDYPVYAKKVTDLVNSKECELGILLCGTGIGMSIAEATRQHNDANVLCLGARVIGPELAFRIADTFIDAQFSGDERHKRRISMLED